MKIYWYQGHKNVVGWNVRRLRKALNPPLNQRELAEKMQLLGYEIDDNTIWRIEKDKRFVADFEVKGLSEALEVPIEELYRDFPRNNKPSKGSKE